MLPQFRKLVKSGDKVCSKCQLKTGLEQQTGWSRDEERKETSARKGGWFRSAAGVQKGLLGFFSLTSLNILLFLWGVWECSASACCSRRRQVSSDVSTRDLLSHWGVSLELSVRAGGDSRCEQGSDSTLPWLKPGWLIREGIFGTALPSHAFCWRLAWEPLTTTWASYTRLAAVSLSWPLTSQTGMMKSILLLLQQKKKAWVSNYHHHQRTK